jgi:4-hydroxybenzoate polyprenyltransferase
LVRVYASLIKVSHTVFALPFALAAIVLAAPRGEITVTRVALIVLCIAAARTAAMAFNRLVDRDFDAANPRTAGRELPRGAVRVTGVVALVVASCVVFVAGAAALGTMTLLLSPIALGLALGYSYTKRFTAWCHLVLGAAVSLAPGGAWIAVGAPVDAAAWLLVLAVAAWVGGFDVLYAQADREFDLRTGLRSIPAALGPVGARVASALLHAVTVGALIAAGVLLERGPIYFAGCAVAAGVLVAEQWLAPRARADGTRGGDLWLHLNAAVSVVFLVGVGLDAWLGGGS